MRADGEVRDHVGGSVQKLTPVFSPGVPFLCFGFRLAARAMGGAIPMGAADGRSPNPDHGRCRCRWRAARRKDMRLRTGGSAHANGREREQRYARELRGREQRPRAVDVPRAGRGREAHDPCTRPRVRPRCTEPQPYRRAACRCTSVNPLLACLCLSRSRLSGGTTSTTRFIGEAPVEARDATEDLLGTQYEV